MGAFSSVVTRSSLGCCYLLIVSSSMISGFTTTSLGRKNILSNRKRHRSCRPGRYCNVDGSGLALVVPGPSQPWDGPKKSRRRHQSALCLSFETEVPIVSEVISTYARCLKYHYFPTQSLTNAMLTVVGDGIAQIQEASLEQSNSQTNANGSADKQYDHKRGLVYFFKGLGSGIMWAWWFDMAEVWSMELTKTVLSQWDSVFHQPQDMLDLVTSATVLDGSTISPTTDVLSGPAQTIRTAINILLEQFLVCPILFSLWDIPVTSTMRGCPTEQVPTEIQRKLFPLLVANAKVWTLVNVVTYNIPLEYRLLFTSAASIVSESINSGITSKQVGASKPPPIVVDPQFVSISATPTMETGIGASIDSTAYAPSAAVAVMIPMGSSGNIRGKNNTSLQL